MSRFRIRNLVIGLALGSAIAAVPIGSIARADDSALDQFMAETANTPAQHQAIAKYYRAKAAEAKADANSHRSMAKSYSVGTSVPMAKQQAEHCNKLASLSDSQAAAYEQLAASHEAQAKQAK